jgi:hypothetical protein
MASGLLFESAERWSDTETKPNKKRAGLSGALGGLKD